SPPSGPPSGTCASRRMETAPAPPSPPLTLRPHSSTNPDTADHATAGCARTRGPATRSGATGSVDQPDRITNYGGRPSRRVVGNPAERRVHPNPTSERVALIAGIALG